MNYFCWRKRKSKDESITSNYSKTYKRRKTSENDIENVGDDKIKKICKNRKKPSKSKNHRLTHTFNKERNICNKKIDINVLHKFCQKSHVRSYLRE